MNPISTAPKDTQILLGHWDERYRYWHWIASGEVTGKGAVYLAVAGGHDWRDVTTHWAPMPGEPENK